MKPCLLSFSGAESACVMKTREVQVYIKALTGWRISHVGILQIKTILHHFTMMPQMTVFNICLGKTPKQIDSSE